MIFSFRWALLSAAVVRFGFSEGSSQQGGCHNQLLRARHEEDSWHLSSPFNRQLVGCQEPSTIFQQHLARAVELSGSRTVLGSDLGVRDSDQTFVGRDLGCDGTRLWV